MAYKKGELKVRTGPCEHPHDGGECVEYCENAHGPADSRTDLYDRVNKGVWLPHSCDEWVIGGPDEIRDLIDDLYDALHKLGALSGRD